MYFTFLRLIHIIFFLNQRLGLRNVHSRNLYDATLLRSSTVKILTFETPVSPMSLKRRKRSVPREKRETISIYALYRFRVSMSFS